MASGYSERFGSNKLLESFLDKPLFTYTVDLVASCQAEMKIIATRYESVIQYVKKNVPSMSIVWNAHPERGISESIHLGIRYLKQQKDYEEYAGCCFMVCDQPLLQKESMQELFKSFYTNPKGIHMCVTKKVKKIVRRCTVIPPSSLLNRNNMPISNARKTTPMPSI